MNDDSIQDEIREMSEQLLGVLDAMEKLAAAQAEGQRLTKNLLDRLSSLLFNAKPASLTSGGPGVVVELVVNEVYRLRKQVEMLHGRAFAVTEALQRAMPHEYSIHRAADGAFWWRDDEGQAGNTHESRSLDPALVVKSAWTDALARRR